MARTRKAAKPRRPKSTESQTLEGLVRRLSLQLAASATGNVEVEAQTGSYRVAVRLSRGSDWSETTSSSGFIRSSDDLRENEHVPAVRETVAVGPYVGRILRDDSEFKKLVSNINANIVFKDEEATGADRMMTATLQSGLDTLARLVSAEWRGVKLRVTEAWDEDGEHTPNSLHYEARAADITTAPVDGTKLGRLARLAVNAGLGWVYYEDSAHVHVSVLK